MPRDDEPLGTVELMQVDVVAFDDVESQSRSMRGGPHVGCRLARGRLQYWASDGVTGTTLVVCERFRLV